MPRVALRLAYDGTRFAGSQRQPDQRTVEGEVLRGLHVLGALADPRAARFQTASRTDRGVSAAGNVVSFDTTFRLDALLPALGAQVEDVWPHALAEVPADFQARRARLRRYAYFLRSDGPEGLAPRGALDRAVFEAVLSRFEGTRDFRGFARLEPGVDPVRTVTEARVTWERSFAVVHVAGPSFLWNQVRRMVEAARRVASGEAAMDLLEAALKGQRGIDLGCAPPEPLVLVDVEHAPALAWRHHPAAVEAAEAQLGARIHAVEREAAVLDALRRQLRAPAPEGS